MKANENLAIVLFLARGFISTNNLHTPTFYLGVTLSIVGLLISIKG